MERARDKEEERNKESHDEACDIDARKNRM